MSTRDYIKTLTSLKPGEMGLLRTHAGHGIDTSAEAFDLFAGLWWPLRSKNQRAPQREVAWLIAKLYAAAKITHEENAVFARQLARCQPHSDTERERFRQRFDRLLQQPRDSLETHLSWGLRQLAQHNLPVDWEKLTDDFSIWQRRSVRRTWAEQFLGIKNTEGEEDAD